jgi:hypothetical protein
MKTHMTEILSSMLPAHEPTLSIFAAINVFYAMAVCD